MNAPPRRVMASYPTCQDAEHAVDHLIGKGQAAPHRDQGTRREQRLRLARPDRCRAYVSGTAAKRYRERPRD